jgi:hypothetical protein
MSKRADFRSRLTVLLVASASTLAACTPGPLEVAVLSPDSLSLGLVAHWTFDEGAGTVIGDHSGNGHTGALVGGAWITGRFGNALHFEIGDGVSVPDFPQASGSMSVSLWVRPPAGDFGNPFLTLISTEIVWTGGWELNVRLTPASTIYDFGFPRGNFQDDTTYELFDCSCVEVNQWTHLVAVVDGQAEEIVFYSNGEFQGHSSIANPLKPGSPTLYIGRWSELDRQFTGDLDDIAVYSRALAPAEAAALYQHPAPDPP